MPIAIAAPAASKASAAVTLPTRSPITTVSDPAPSAARTSIVALATVSVSRPAPSCTSIAPDRPEKAAMVRSSASSPTRTSERPSESVSSVT